MLEVLVSYPGLVLSPSCSGLDEVIFSYVLGVLEDLGPSGPSEENFDMEAFTEMMEAYVPGFAHIPRWELAGGQRGGGGLADCGRWAELSS